MASSSAAISADVADRIIGRGVHGAHPPAFVADGVTWGYMFFCDDRKCAAIKDPPSNGWSTVFVLDEGARTVRVFSLWAMASWLVDRECPEMLTYQRAIGEVDGSFPYGRFREKFPQYYAEFRRRGEANADYDTCVKLMGMLGIPVPTADRYGDFPAVVREQTGGKEAARPKPEREATGFVKVKRDGRKGEVLAFFLDGGSSAEAAVKRFGITRSNLLSQLYLLNKNHGIGYHVKGDHVSVELPEGIEEPFA